MCIVESQITSTSIRLVFSNGGVFSFQKGDLLNLIIQKKSVKNALISLKTSLKESFSALDPDDIKIDFSLDGTPSNLEWNNR